MIQGAGFVEPLYIVENLTNTQVWTQNRYICFVSFTLIECIQVEKSIPLVERILKGRNF